MGEFLLGVQIIDSAAEGCLIGANVSLRTSLSPLSCRYNLVVSASEVLFLQMHTCCNVYFRVHSLLYFVKSSVLRHGTLLNNIKHILCALLSNHGLLERP